MLMNGNGIPFNMKTMYSMIQIEYSKRYSHRTVVLVPLHSLIAANNRE